MILPDVNTLLHAVNRSSNQHAPALRALQQGFDHPRGVGFAWTVLLAFLRLSTRRGIFPSPLSVEEAWLEVVLSGPDLVRFASRYRSGEDPCST
jgi:uncharacterized protein